MKYNEEDVRGLKRLGHLPQHAQVSIQCQVCVCVSSSHLPIHVDHLD